ncbi:MAG: hypothetical protein WBF13_09455 [Candidatus Zixiibacteriota bacterium]
MPAQFKQEWLDEALETLSHYNVVPVIDEFLKGFNLPLGGLQSQKLQRIGREIADPTKPPFFEDLADYIDELKMYGKQHVFLYELKGDHKDYLNELRDPHYIREQLRQFDLEDSFNNGKPLWEAPEPKLAEVRHSFKDGEGLVLFKWIETRNFLIWTVDQNGRQILQPTHERSANFFVVNLKNGRAEIRIQTRQPFAARNLREELDIYRKELSRLIRFSRFTPIPLEPVVRSLLGRLILPIRSWELIHPKGGRLIGAGDPSFFRKLGLPFGVLFGREITLLWECEQRVTGKPELFFTVNGESDHVKFNAITDKSKVDFVLDELRKLSKEIIEMEELKQLAMRYPEYSRVISAIDHHFSRLKELKITAHRLSSEVWYSEDFIEDVFEAAAKSFPKTFYREGEERKILAIHIHFRIDKGAWYCTNRKAERIGRSKILKPVAAVAFTSTFGFVIVETIMSEIKHTVFEELWNRLWSSIPFKVVEMSVLLIVGLVYFGSRSFAFLRKIPQQLLSTTLTLFFGTEAQKTREFIAKYKKWDEERVRVGFTDIGFDQQNED